MTQCVIQFAEPSPGGWKKWNNRINAIDFSDLSNEGFTFDKFKADVKLHHGNASLQGATVDGPVAHLEFSGNINLAKKGYNVLLTVAPKITSSLPVVATIAGGPIAGAVTWAANKLLHKQVEKASSRQYKITGTWDKPHVEQVQR